MDLAFFETNERTEYSDDLYWVIGRALTVATHFEQNCKAVANTMEIRQNINLMHNSQKFHKFIEKLSKRSLGGGIKKFSSTITEGLQSKSMDEEVITAFNEVFFQPLEKGREARNFIAHELASGIAGSADNENIRMRTINIIKENISLIADADFIVAGFIENHFNKNGVFPNKESYVKRIVDWVCISNY